MNHWDERWTAHLMPLISSQEPEAREVGVTNGELAAVPPLTVAPRKPTFLQKERWKAVQKARAQGHVVAGHRTGAGDPQVHHQEISGGRRTSEAAFADGSHVANIGYYGNVIE